MHCGICNRPKTNEIEFICAHCINGSPSILLREKIQLLRVRQEVLELKNEVEKQLDSGFRGEGHLGKQLQKLEIYNERRSIAKLRQKETYIKEKLKLKQSRLQESKLLLSDELRDDSTGFRERTKEMLLEETGSLNMLMQVLKRNQLETFQLLCSWFRIERCEDNTLFPYSIWNMPIVNVKYTNEMSSENTLTSMRYIQQYIKLSLKIWLLEGTSKVDFETEQDIIEKYSSLIYDTLRLLRARQLVSASASLRNILIRYDLDGMIYHLSQNTYLASLEDTSNTYPPTVKNVRDLVESMLPSV